MYAPSEKLALKLRQASYLDCRPSGASSPPRQPRQLPWLIFETLMSSLADLKKKNLYFSTKHKKTPEIMKILGLPSRFEEINIFLILPSIEKLFKYTGSSLQIWRNKYFYYSTKQKNNFLNILGLLSRIEKNIYLYHYTKDKKLLKYIETSLQILENKYFFVLPSKKISLTILGLLCRIEEINIFIILPSKKLLEYTGSSLWIWKKNHYSTKHKKLL